VTGLDLLFWFFVLFCFAFGGVWFLGFVVFSRGCSVVVVVFGVFLFWICG